MNAFALSGRLHTFVPSGRLNTFALSGRLNASALSGRLVRVPVPLNADVPRERVLVKE